MINRILSYRSWQFCFVFGVDWTCMINQVVVLSSLHHKPSLIESILKVQFHFQCRVDLYHRSRPCPVLPSWKIAHYLISLDCSISYSVKITLAWLVTSMYYLLFVIDPTLPDWSWQFRSDFGIDRTCMISHVVVLFGLLHRLYLFESVIIV